MADGPAATFPTIWGPYQLYDLFDAYAISEEVGATNPTRPCFCGRWSNWPFRRPSAAAW
ncbi:MAG: hypothetical protein R3A10_02440 [Caldilineaceae bacterium]